MKLLQKKIDLQFPGIYGSSDLTNSSLGQAHSKAEAQDCATSRKNLLKIITIY